MDWQQVGAAALSVGGLVGLYLNYRSGVKKAATNAKRELEDTREQLNTELRALLDLREEELERLRSKEKDLEGSVIQLTNLYGESLEAIRARQQRELLTQARLDDINNENQLLRKRISELERKQIHGGNS